MRITGGFFLGNRMHYQKPALTYDQQYDLLTARGLAIADRHRAMSWLRRVSYYRLSAYLLPFKTGEAFNDGSTFDDVAGLYIFDRKLRLIMMDAIERFEVSLRTSLTYEISHRYGPFGYADATNFHPRFNHAALMKELAATESKSQETFLGHYRSKYTSEALLPLWMASELLSFGWLSRIYSASHPSIKRTIARRLDIHDSQLSSWLHSLTYIRNVCAHHMRLWNRELAVKPSLPHKCAAWPYEVPSTDRMYCMLVIAMHCMSRIAPRCGWRRRLLALFDEHPKVDLSAMRIPKDWRDRSPWKS
jgi:abortive infection bacteriophage resistance protein